MKLYIITTASYSEDGDLEPSFSLYKSLKAAKVALKEDHEIRFNDQGTPPCDDLPDGSDDYMEGDKDHWISDDGMKSGSSGPNQEYSEIDVIDTDKVK